MLGRFTLDLDPVDKCDLGFRLVLTMGCRNLFNMGPLDSVISGSSSSSHKVLVYEDFSPHSLKPIPVSRGTQVLYPAAVNLGEGYGLSQVLDVFVFGATFLAQLVLNFLYQLVSFEWIGLIKLKAELFLKQLNDIYDTLQYNDTKKLTFAAFRFRGEAKDWWLRISEARILRNQRWIWDDFQEEFNQEYIPRWIREYREDEFQQLN
ncbi:hypothetical protein M9H77_25344 [Catharanthus roseus]|uniref:Uncharacterized protein n=1 Tax=Catharanthus roseus TaxID=4058 RepID=A0ACC0AAM6_CATRO|nr:hypothetical protein M9H77_25344 [Catharanthus roseus]